MIDNWAAWANHQCVEWFLGLVGFSYPEWMGTFYPPALAEQNRLAHVAAHFNAVEINTTFYGPPSEETLRRWASATPPQFRFCLKMQRDVTHGPTPPGSLAAAAPPPGHLLQQRTHEMVNKFFEPLEVLGGKLGPVLLQFPPGFSTQRHEELAAFLDRLPRTVRIAVEFRHDSWWTPATEAMLRERRICWVATDESSQNLAVRSPDDSGAARSQTRPIISTTDFLYVRWLGRHGQFLHRRHEHFDPIPRLTWWVQRLRKIIHEHPALHAVHGFFDNDFAGHAPTTARRLADLLGLSRPAGAAEPAREPTLFET